MPPATRARTVWHEVLEARHREHRRNGDRSRETLRADERELWAAELLAALDLALVGVGLAPAPAAEVVDPRDALVELMAVAASWTDAMDGTPWA